jgi:hypothetical protein
VLRNIALLGDFYTLALPSKSVRVSRALAIGEFGIEAESFNPT